MFSFLRQDNGYRNGPNSTNSEVNLMSSSSLGASNNGVALSNCVPGRAQSLFKGSITSKTEEKGQQPPEPPHRSFPSDAGVLSSTSSIFTCQAQKAESNNR